MFTYDFSTLYTTLPHNLSKEKNIELRTSDTLIGYLPIFRMLHHNVLIRFDSWEASMRDEKKCVLATTESRANI